MTVYFDCLLCVTSFHFRNNFSCYSLLVVLLCSFTWNWAQNIEHLSRVEVGGRIRTQNIFFFPDPGSPKRYGSFGSETLLETHTVLETPFTFSLTSFNSAYLCRKTVHYTYFVYLVEKKQSKNPPNMKNYECSIQSYVVTLCLLTCDVVVVINYHYNYHIILTRVQSYIKWT